MSTSPHLRPPPPLLLLEVDEEELDEELPEDLWDPLPPADLTVLTLADLMVFMDSSSSGLRIRLRSVFPAATEI